MALQALEQEAMTPNPRWLKPGVALELQVSISEDRVAMLIASLRDELSGQPIDVNCVDVGAQRRKKLLIADMDSTIIEQECIDEVAAFAGVGGQVSHITERAMRGEIGFEGALRERVGLLKGLAEADLDRVIAERISISDGARTLVNTMKAHGAYCALVSGGFRFFTSQIRQRVGFDEDRSNVLLFKEGKLSGEVAEPILGREAKLERLEAILAERSINPEASLAVGDGANDLAMIERAGLGVAFRAKPIVAEKADADIRHCDLTGLLYLQGYTENQFVDSTP
ncbi:MAG: phosphoserine phosphatase SerB [Pseudomonadota bacterium]